MSLNRKMKVYADPTFPRDMGLLQMFEEGQLLVGDFADGVRRYAKVVRAVNGVCEIVVDLAPDEQTIDTTKVVLVGGWRKVSATERLAGEA